MNMKISLSTPCLLLLKAIEKLNEKFSNNYWTWYGKSYLKMFGAKSEDWSSVQFKGKCILQIQKRTKIYLGKGFICNSGNKYVDNKESSIIRVLEGGSLCIGRGSGMTNSALICKESVSIGNYVNIGSGTIIIDTNSHSTNWEKRMKRGDGKTAKSAPIVIEDHVFIGARSIILKGVTIGEKSIVAAGSVVAKSIPSGEIWGGNPARFIKKIE